MTETVKTEVNIILSGEPPAVQQAEFMLLQGTDSVEVECLPGDLIHSIEVDVSTLSEIDDAIYVKDLQVPDNVTILADGDELVAKIQRLRLAVEEEEVEEEMVEMAPEEVEVIAKGKEVEGAEEEA